MPAMLDSPAKEAQRRYLDAFSPEEQAVGFRKPWSDPGCAGHLADLGALLMLLPKPPARLLDLGCGMGWTSVIFARYGYDVVGVDLAANMIAMANRKREEERVPNLRFECLDFEADPERFGQFDCAVFYDSLHHSDDEVRALGAAFRALRPGGICITVEPGVGHSTSPQALEEVQRTGVTERDMEPARIIAAAGAAGFSSWSVYPRGRAAVVATQAPLVRRAWRAVLLLLGAVRQHPHEGMVALRK